MYKYILVFLFSMQTGYAMVATKACHPLLWPDKTAIVDSSISVPTDIINELEHYSKKFLHHPIHPISVLHSAGVSDINDPRLIASREGYKDADSASVMALTYRLTHNIDYLNKTKEILISWANTNHPSGHPIDETKLEGMIWAYDLIACDISNHDKNKILTWFEQIRQRKMTWKFGDKTSKNNHRIHQLKMILLLDKILHYKTDITSIIKYSNINLNAETGESLDYLERSALYYHNYVMQPWLEISLISGCCRQSITRAFFFLSDKILHHDIGNEFAHSQAKIDQLRANGGFVYAVKNGNFDVTKAAPTIVMYYTIFKTKPNPKLWSILQYAKPSPWLVFLKARRILWHS